MDIKFIFWVDDNHKFLKILNATLNPLGKTTHTLTLYCKAQPSHPKQPDCQFGILSVSQDSLVHKNMTTCYIKMVGTPKTPLYDA